MEGSRLLREAYVLGTLILISMHMAAGALKTECISTALCNVLQGDIQRDVGKSFQKHYDEAIKEMKKHMKFLDCEIEKINENCAERGRMCMAGLKFLAGMNYGSKGLRPQVFYECSVGSWSYLLLLCKNQKNWPKFVTDNLPKEFMVCNSTCMEMSEFDEYHKKNGKTDADFPPFWKEKMALVEENKNLSQKFVLEGTKIRAVENRQAKPSEGPNPWERTSIVEQLTFGNEFVDGDSLRPELCDKNTWITNIIEDLPSRIFFQCATGYGVLSSFSLFPQDNPILDFISPTEFTNNKGDLSLTRVVTCKVNKFKTYQTDNTALLVGMQYRIDGNRRLHSGRYLCAGDPILTAYSRQVAIGDRPDFTSNHRCPALTAACSIGGKTRNGQMVQLTIGCCPVPPIYIQSAQVFSVLPYTWGGVVRNTTKVFESTFTTTYDWSPYSFSVPQTWICPPNYYIDSFQGDIIIPLINIPYLFTTRFYCSSVTNRSNRQELKGLAQHWNSFRVRENDLDNRLSTQSHTCAQGYYTGGEFQCNGNTLSKKFRCGDQFQSVDKTFFPAGERGFFGGETFGWWSLKRVIVLAERFPSIPDFQVEFKCPPTTALCGVGVVGGKNIKGRSKADMSAEGLFYDHFCCPITLQLCTESEISVKLDRIPSHCNIPAGANGTCIISYLTTVIQVYENNTNTMRSESDKTSWNVNGMIGVGPIPVINSTVSLGLGYSSVSEKIKMYGFSGSVSTTTSLTTNSTQTFFIDQGRTLLAYRAFIYCGGFKIGARSIISIQTPSTQCTGMDKFVVFDEINPENVEKNVNVSYFGYGTRWIGGRRADQIDIPWINIVTNLPSRFNANPLLTISPVTKFRWQSVDKDVFDEYKPVQLSFEYTIKPGLRYRFSRVLGFCGDDWEIYPRVTAQNVHVETFPVQ